MRHLSRTYASIAFGTVCVLSANGCSSEVEPAPPPKTGTTASALTGAISFAPSCMTEPSPQTVPPAVPAQIRRNLQISEAYTRIVASSPAFRECIASTMARRTQVGTPSAPDFSGPYHACDGDPTPSTVDEVMRHVLSPNGTLINCDFSALGTARGGSAGIGAIDELGREVLNFGNQLGTMNLPANCTYNPDGAPCVDDGGYKVAAGTLGHEIMHTHGYAHVSDAVWNLNNVNVGDRFGTDADGNPLHFDLGHFCGVEPTFTPGNDGIAPTAPTDSPTPGVHPTYGTGIPYQVGSCIDAVLAWAIESGHLHDDCGERFAGLTLVDSIFTGTPETATTSCIADPYSAGPAPIPPRTPTSCELVAGCSSRRAPTLFCDDNANPVHLERRLIGSTRPWRPSLLGYSAAYEYRACAESLYGRACTGPLPIASPTLCLPEAPRLKPLPWWKMRPYGSFIGYRSPLASRLGQGHVLAVGISAAEASDYPELGTRSGDLSKELGALAVGIYNPDLGIFPALGPSKGELPSLRGTAFALTMGPDGKPHLLGFGGETDDGALLASLYDGAMAVDDEVTQVQTDWTKRKLEPGARAFASAAASLDGTSAYLVGGLTPSGVTGDLWAYDVAKGGWARVSSQAVSPRTSPAIAVGDGQVIVFGGKDAGGKLLSDVAVVDLSTGKAKVMKTSLTPRENATIALAGDELYVYGGESGNGPAETLEVVSLVDGKTILASKVGVAASYGSALGIDDDGVLSLVPGAASKASAAAGAFVGLFGKLTFIALE